MANLTLTQHLLKKKRKWNEFTFFTQANLEYWKNYRNVKEKYIFKKGGEEKENPNYKSFLP